MNLKLPTLNLKKNGRFLGFGSSAKRDWKIIFFTSMFLSVAAVAFSAYVFIDINNGEVPVDRETHVEAPLSADALTRVTSYYQDKALRLEEIKLGKDTILDPSL